MMIFRNINISDLGTGRLKLFMDKNIGPSLSNRVKIL